MIISRTPFRISFAGGGSDLEEFYNIKTGAVLSVSIDKYMYLSMHPLFNKNNFFLKYSKNEIVEDINHINHPIIREIFSDYKLSGIDFNSSADIPSGTGLASSSAFTVGLINLCNAYVHRFMSKEQIANYACEIEIARLQEPIGKQDQYACAIGGMNFLEFHPDNSVCVEKIHLSREKLLELEESLMLFYLGKTRSASSVLKEQKKIMGSDQDKFKIMEKMVELAYSLKAELQNNDISNFGQILHAGWNYKRGLASKITNSEIDANYDIAIKNGADGGKLLGAGGGGFLLLYAKKEKQLNIRNALSHLHQVEFSFENSGTTIIY
jgi:D-glycero-alpha-D-manno-heptose-7-phosphate kinase